MPTNSMLNKVWQTLEIKYNDYKDQKLMIMKDKYYALKIKLDTQKPGKVISDEERKL